MEGDTLCLHSFVMGFLAPQAKTDSANVWRSSIFSFKRVSSFDLTWSSSS